MRWTKVTERILIAGGVLFFLALAAISLLPKQPKSETRATVTFIGGVPGADPYAPLVRIVAKTQDGRTAQMSVPSNQLHCKVGDRIPASRRGTSVHLDPSSCADLGRYD
ncbi:MAG TPA: hypothetical protein VFP12_03075 [Allosphingosinicella sp.]|nr:hypothetical protein [Allosphingosinicella sp.]